MHTPERNASAAASAALGGNGSPQGPDNTVGPPGAGKQAHPLIGQAIGNGMVLIVLLAWWLASRSMGDVLVPDPIVIGLRMLQVLFDPSLALHWVWSLLRVLGSVLLAVLLGGFLALLPRWFPVFEGIVHQLLKPFLISFPTVAWAILATIWFGVSTSTVLFIQVVILVPYCLINISEGVRVLDPELAEMGRSFTRRPVRLMMRVVLPQLVPYFIAALRIAYGVAWKIALIAEMFGAQSGLGYLMVRAQSYADGNTVLATCLVIVILFWAGDRLLIAPLSRRFGGHG